MLKPYEDGKLILKTLIGGIFVLSLVGYGLFQAKKIVEGPELELYSPTLGQTVEEERIAISGKALNISAIWLNDRPIVTDESGLFNEKLMLYPGYNIIMLKAEDKFGSRVEKKIEVVYKQ